MAEEMPASSPSNRIVLPQIDVGEKKKKEKPAKHNDNPQKAEIGYDTDGNYTKQKKKDATLIVTRRVPKDMQNKKEFANSLADELAAQYGKKVKVRLEVLDDSEGSGGSGGGGSGSQAPVPTGYDATVPPPSSLNPSQAARNPGTIFDTLQNLTGQAGTGSVGSFPNASGTGGTGGGTGTGTGGGAGGGGTGAGGANYGGNLNFSGTSGAGRTASESYLGRSMTDSEYDDLQRATAAEAGNKNQLEVAMVTASILNRARINNQTIRQVLTEKRQFESVTGRQGVGFHPSPVFRAGPNDARASQIYGGMENLLPLISKNQTDFTAANPYAYGQGFARGQAIIDGRIKKGFVQVGQSLFNTAPPDISRFNQ